MGQGKGLEREPHVGHAASAQGAASRALAQIGYFDEDANSAGALSEFLESRVSLVQGLNEAPAGLSFLAILVSTCVVSIVCGTPMRLEELRRSPLLLSHPRELESRR